ATVILVGFVSRVSRIKEDTAIGIMYTGIFALGGLLASHFSDRIHVDLYHFIIGTVLSIRDSELWMMGIVTAVVLSLVMFFFRHLQITSFDPVMATSLGISVLAIDYLLTACTSLVVISAVPLVGVILVVGLLITPAATAYLLCDRLSHMQMLAAAFGVSGVVGGLYVSTWVGTIGTGPAIVVFTTLQFLVVLLVSPRYGMIADWYRRWSTVPQQLVEDILGCFRADQDRRVTLDFLNRYIDSPPAEVRRGLRWLVKQDLLERDNQEFVLTATGVTESRRLLRAHRLWESYLQHLGLPEEELHRRAHVLEHVHDEETVDYLDDKLGHPLTDPHGTEIPEDFVHLVPGTVVRASLLRDGHEATIESLEPDAGEAPLKPGDRIRMGVRSPDGETWMVHLEDDTAVELSHHQADAVMVRLESL
ncbi:MAG: iron chelate uptake ABC transporter family permease subunit, partial [Planctomycetota bacterium]